MIPAAEIARLKVIADKATPGKWRVRYNGSVGADFEDGYTLIAVTPKPNSPTGSAHVREWAFNAEHIAAFYPPTAKALLAALEQSLGKCAKAKAVVQAYWDADEQADAHVTIMDLHDILTPEYPTIRRKATLAEAEADYEVVLNSYVAENQRISDERDAAKAALAKAEERVRELERSRDDAWASPNDPPSLPPRRHR